MVHHVDLHFAEMPREAHLHAGRHILRRKQQHLVAQERLVDALEQFVGDAVRELDAQDLGAEIRGQRTHGKRQAQVGGGVHGDATSPQFYFGQM